MMTDADLTQLVRDVSQTYFHRPFTHAALFNPRLRTTGGRYHLGDHHLDFNPKVLVYYDQNVLIGLIKHELCHYHLHLSGQPYQHRSPVFKHWLQQVQGLRYTPPFPQAGQKLVLYQCQGCQILYYRRRRLDVTKYICRKCGGRLKFIKMIQKNN